ncbi:MAG: 3D-(3,5/4)-trihydroxycyclohexane-1,2-dione acylhydrolase (decyclizing), partial [Acidobacteria bacterium]|nr:3D-(3,5/4)-trihydroxycyclohexane-1,2-dione acylhydrolase (decyclizing) [Acidobacteriota bacterium]
ALVEARKTDRTTVITVKNDRYVSVPGYESWWDVPVAEVSEMPSVQEARKGWEEMRAKERYFLESAE